jgi:putative hemolysin
MINSTSELSYLNYPIESTPTLKNLDFHLKSSNPQRDPSCSKISVEWAKNQDQVRSAQRLRYQVFTNDMGARFPKNCGEYDIDLFDDFCEHLIVKNQVTDEVIGTYRLLTPTQAERVGSTYFETEFDMTRLRGLRKRMVELGRSCVHPDHRHGGVIMALWGELFKFMDRNSLDTMIGSASIPMLKHDLNMEVASKVWSYVKSNHMAPIDFHVRTRSPFHLQPVTSDSVVELPSLIRAYLRLGAKVIGAPAWDPNFNTVDLPMMMRVADLKPKYKKHFFGT